MSLYLVFFGLGSFLGNYLGGRVSDRIGYARSMLLGAVAQALMVFLMLFMRNSLWVMVILISLWVMSSWFMGLQLNSGVAQETNNQSNFLLSLTGSAIQLGSAVGTSIVAVWISAGHMNELPWFALLSALVVTLLQIFSIKRHHSVKEDQSDSQANKPPNEFV
jgi:DHA1 family putative efflux transporter-like MFS transporter